MPFVRRFALHLAAAVGATGVFVLAAVVGAQQARPADTRPAAATVVAERTPRPARTPRAIPERSVAGQLRELLPDGEFVLTTPRGVELQVRPVEGALIKLNGRPARLDALQAGDRVVVLGQAQGRGRFMAHAITARRR